MGGLEELEKIVYKRVQELSNVKASLRHEAFSMYLGHDVKEGDMPRLKINKESGSLDESLVVDNESIGTIKLSKQGPRITIKFIPNTD